MRVAALTSGKDDPSARFRIRQFVEPLQLYGVEVREYFPVIDKHAAFPTKILKMVPRPFDKFVESGWNVAKLLSRLPGTARSWNADLTWLNRELVFGKYTLERFIRRPYVFDVDDAIWQAKPDGKNAVARIAGQAAVVFAGNKHIANHFEQLCDRVEIVPTAIDTGRFHPSDIVKQRPGKFVIGWTGSAGNLHYLYAIECALNRFLATHDAELVIVAERAPSFSIIPQNKVRFIKWSPMIESSALREMDVGLMPLPDTDWARGKCGFKMLQYMSTALPVVVSPVGVNAEILAKDNVGFGARTEDEWFFSLEYLYNNPDRAIEMGANGRVVVEEYFSLDVVTRSIAEIFQDLSKKVGVR